MKRRYWLLGIAAISAAAIIIILINRFMTALPDGVVRAAGILLMAGLLVFGYGTARSVSGKNVSD